MVVEPRGFAIALDGKPLKTPAKQPLIVPAEALALAIAEEWESQGETVRPASMPLTTLATTAIDRLLPDPAAAIAEICGYANAELLCHRADRPDELVRHQARQWQPWLDWIEARHGARLATGEGVVPIRQSEDALEALRHAALRHAGFGLMALHALTQTLGSIVLALAVAEGELDAAEAADLALLDELYQARQWGEEPEARLRREAIRDDAAASARFLALARNPLKPRD